MNSKNLIQLTNKEYMLKYNVKRKDLPRYIESYSYKSMMFGFALRDAWEAVKAAFRSGVQKGKK